MSVVVRGQGKLTVKGQDIEGAGEMVKRGHEGTV